MSSLCIDKVSQVGCIKQEKLICEDDFCQNSACDEIKTFNIIANKDEILQMYLKDISKIKLLKKNEELEIGKKIKEGSSCKIHLDMSVI